MNEFDKYENNPNNFNNENFDYSNEIIDCTSNENEAYNNNQYSYDENLNSSEKYQPNVNEGYNPMNIYQPNVNEGYNQANTYQPNINEGYNQMNTYQPNMNEGYNQMNTYQSDMNEGYNQANTFNSFNTYSNNANNMQYYNQNQPQNTQDFITIKNTDTAKEKKNKGKFFKGVKVATMLVVCCASVGAGIGFGMNKSKSYVEAEVKENTLKFQFPESESSEETEIVGDESVVLTGTNTIAPIINKVKDSVVNISIKTQTTNFFNQVYESTGAGSGIIVDQDEEKVYIVTNNHVIEGASAVQISITGEEQIPASLVGKDASSDLALIYVLKTDLKGAGIAEVKNAVFADSDQMEVGEYVLAVGNALGEGKTVTQGIISARNKEINIDGKKLTVLQTDAAINPGNSGGALINTDGEVVGINTAKLSSSSVEGIGYAIPSSYAKTIIAEIKENGSIERPYLGISGFTINDSFKQTYNINIDGVFLSKVEEGSAAATAGLRYTDIIVGFNGQKITTIEELSDAIAKCKANDKVSVDFIRNGMTKMNTTVTLSSYNSKF